MVITAHFEAKGMDSGFQNYLSTIAETSNEEQKGRKAGSLFGGHLQEEGQ